MDIQAEKSFVESFVKPELRERWLLMLQGKRRKKHLGRLYHHFDFTGKRIEKFAVKAGSGEMAKAFGVVGLTEPYYLISVNADFDGRWVDNAFLETMEFMDGYVVYCSKTGNAVFRDEYDFHLLSNKG